MNIGIIGSGGREHSLCFKLLQSKKVGEIFCIPGNAGTSKICKNLDLDISNFDKLYHSIKKNDIKLIIVGPEIPLVQGITDFLEKKILKYLDQIKKHLN